VDGKKIIQMKNVTFTKDSSAQDHLEDSPGRKSGDNDNIIDTFPNFPTINVGGEDEGEEQGDFDTSNNDSSTSSVMNNPNKVQGLKWNVC